MALAPERAHMQPAAGTDVSVSLRTLVLIRWVAVIGQAVTVLFVHYGWASPSRPKARSPRWRSRRRSTSWRRCRAAAAPASATARRALYLAYDTLQLGVLLFLTGGLQNPFAILMLAPVTVSATILSRSQRHRAVGADGGRARVLALVHLPLPARPGAPLEPRPLYVLGMWTALVSLDRVHRRLYLVGGRGGAAHARRLCRDPARARPRAAHLGGGRARRRRRASARQPAGHHRRRRQGAGARLAAGQPSGRGRASCC